MKENEIPSQKQQEKEVFTSRDVICIENQTSAKITLVEINQEESNENEILLLS